MLSVIKPGGLMFFSVPTADGVDGLAWNAHRVYGKHRLEKIFAGWKLIDVIGRGSPKFRADKPLEAMHSICGFFETQMDARSLRRIEVDCVVLTQQVASLLSLQRRSCRYW